MSFPERKLKSFEYISIDTEAGTEDRYTILKPPFVFSSNIEVTMMNFFSHLGSSHVFNNIKLYLS